MLTSRNLVVLIGNVGKDAEVKHFENGGTITIFPLATTEKYKDKDGNRNSKTEWHNIKINHGKLAEYIKKGDLLSITGKIRTVKKDDKYFTNIEAEGVQFLGGNNKSSVSSSNSKTEPNPMEHGNTNFDKNQETNTDNKVPEEEDDLPF